VAQAQRDELLRVLKNAQRLLAPIKVHNPYAPALTFPTERTRNRRDHEKYLTLIDSIALLHQYQRPRHRKEIASGRVIEYIDVTIDDIALANQLAPEVLARSLDELPPQTRTLLERIRALIRAKRKKEKSTSTFSRRELREFCGWSLTQVRAHLERLVDLEYLELRHARLGGAFVYELMLDPEAPEAVAHIGLIDVETLRKKHTYDRGVAGENGGVAGGGETPPPGVK
jgi:hypothetical protein